MLNTALAIAIGLLAAALALSGYRLLRGRSAADRIVALDALYLNGAGLLLLLGVQFATDLYFEAALLIAALGFLTTAALARYVARDAIIE